MVQSLNKKWKEVLYAASGFGPNLLMVLMGAYYSDALNPAGFTGINPAGQTILGHVCLVLPALFPILLILGKVFDGIIDVPFASITDNLNTRWGRRRPPIAIAFIPMVVSFALCWYPVFGVAESAQLGNSIWFTVMSLIFFASYTMCLICFYGSLSNVCTSTAQRIRVSAFKSFFDTISYVLVYALVPLILGVLNENLGWGIDKFVFLLLPVMFTMLIPLFMIKEGKKYGYPENDGAEKQEKISLPQSLSITFKNRIFRRWLVVDCCAFFGLQMFLVSMNTLLKGGMGFTGWEITLCNTFAFAPVPVMLYLFQKLKAKKGIRFTYQTCLLSFGVAILAFFFSSKLMCGDNKLVQYIISCAGGVAASWAIGSFFMMPMVIPSQISAVEERLTKQNHSSMYFAAQAFCTSVIGAIASYGVYDILKNIFFTTGGNFVWAESTIRTVIENGVEKEVIISAAQVAAEMMKVSQSQVFNFGITIVPFIVTASCLLGFFFACKMPKDFSPKEVAREFKKMNPALDISAYETAPEAKPEKQEILFVQIALSILSGFIFGFIWAGFMFHKLKSILQSKKTAVLWALACFVPFAAIFILNKKYKALAEKYNEAGLQLNVKNRNILAIVFGVLFPVLPLNVVSLALLQLDINKYYNATDADVEEDIVPDMAPSAEAAEA
ncbi:MAG: MFS transporter [Clostridiales bacterium]|nr:MFS transporter [Clostridiales bacterium]